MSFAALSNEISRGWDRVHLGYQLFNKPAFHSDRNQALSTALAVAAVATAFFCLAGLPIVGLALGVAAGATTFAWQCYKITASPILSTLTLTGDEMKKYFRCMPASIILRSGMQPQLMAAQIATAAAGTQL